MKKQEETPKTLEQQLVTFFYNLGCALNWFFATAGLLCLALTIYIIRMF